MASMNSRLYLNKQQSTPSKTTNIQNINKKKMQRDSKDLNLTMNLLHSYLRIPFSPKALFSFRRPKSHLQCQWNWWKPVQLSSPALQTYGSPTKKNQPFRPTPPQGSLSLHSLFSFSSLSFLLAALPFLYPRPPTSVFLSSLVPPPSIPPILGLTRRWINNNSKMQKLATWRGVYKMTTSNMRIMRNLMSFNSIPKLTKERNLYKKNRFIQTS